MMVIKHIIYINKCERKQEHDKLTNEIRSLNSYPVVLVAGVYDIHTSKINKYYN